MKFAEVKNLIAQAKTVDKFAHRGDLAVAVKQGMARVERVTYDARGVSTVIPCCEFVPLELLALNLNAEANYGVGNV